MPQRPTHTAPSSSRAAKIQVEKISFFRQLKSFFSDSRTHFVCGIILLAFALFALIAYFCYFFTGNDDQSWLQMSRAERIAGRDGITNILGLPGAQLSDWLIDDTFGIFSILFIIMGALYGLVLMGWIHIKNLKLFICSAFLIVWGSITLAFLEQTFNWDVFFTLGGAHGTWIADWLTSYIKPVGATIVLCVSLIIFCFLADKHFIEHIKQAIAKTTSLKDRFAGRPASGSDNREAEGEEKSPELIINIEEPQMEIQQKEQIEDIELTIEEEPEKEEIENNEPKTEEEQEAIDVDIEQTEEVELSKQLEPYDPKKDLENYKFPPLDLLKVYDNETAPVINPEEQQANANRIVTTLRNYGIEIESIKATVGPTVTLYEVVPKAGIRIAKIQSLENDIMLSLSAIGIRIIAPMPGKGTVGIEVPNEKPQTVSMHSVIASKRFQEEQKMRLPVAIGRTITNEVFMFDLAKTPHLLVAGATGQGKSVGLNAIITSLLYKKHPAELKFVLVDPKMVEFSIYKPLLRHYMAAMPDQEDRDIIITDCQKVINTLNSLVIEMEDRYTLLADANVRNLEDYNEKFNNRRLNPEKPVENLQTHKILHHHFMPYLVVVIDEYGDFIMQAGKEVERPIQRLAQKARAVGMHMILATQRPDVKIVTGTIKANIPTRIAFRTQSVVDSRTVLDSKGADQLIGKGDMLYSGGGNLTRIQCAFVDTPEVEAIVEHVSEQQHYLQPYQLPEYVPEGAEEQQAGSVDLHRLDPMFDDVARFVVSKQEGSTSRLQRAFEIGYNRAGKLSDQLEMAGIVGPNKGPKGRDVLISDMAQLEALLMQLHEE